ncbi:Uncharacterised protein [Comamonas testosteroni]|uniref:Uncharacterized protein n=1 Tax=Comamonas testosteroni TaxID=285 RepID=A0A8B4S6U6_COMTE|nr:hypothetical protein CTATCC11996_06968 [Comamonas testosteroni ATCC 11996]SUY78035.1 Uncharacterised protein [Comamonas testosteroni]
MGTFTLSLRIIQADAMTALAFNGVAYRKFIQLVHTASSYSVGMQSHMIDHEVT